MLRLELFRDVILAPSAGGHWKGSLHIDFLTIAQDDLKERLSKSSEFSTTPAARRDLGVNTGSLTGTELSVGGWLRLTQGNES